MKTACGARIAAVFAPVGRMALTNYLSQSLVMALVFTGYGLALYDRLSPADVILMTSHRTRASTAPSPDGLTRVYSPSSMAYSGSSYGRRKGGMPSQRRA